MQSRPHCVAQHRFGHFDLCNIQRLVCDAKC